MDSTLIREEVIDEMARLNGAYQDVASITKSAMEGGLNFEESLRKRVQFLEGLSEEEIHSIYSSLNPMSGMTELFSFLRDAGSKIVVLSGGFNPILKLFQKKYPISDFRANELEIKQGLLTGKLLGDIVTPESKGDYVKHFEREYNIPTDQVVSIGDGANDIFMIQKASIGIGFHPKEALKREINNWITDLPLSALIFLFGPNS
jgi:phosphoserine phosphatase